MKVVTLTGLIIFGSESSVASQEHSALSLLEPEASRHGSQFHRGHLLIRPIPISVVIDLGGGPNHDRIGFRYWKNPGPFASYIFPKSPLSTFLGVWVCKFPSLFTERGWTCADVNTTPSTSSLPPSIHFLFFSFGPFMTRSTHSRTPSSRTSEPSWSVLPVSLDKSRIKICAYVRAWRGVLMFTPPYSYVLAIPVGECKNPRKQVGLWSRAVRVEVAEIDADRSS